jgi:hypothetical protein
MTETPIDGLQVLTADPMTANVASKSVSLKLVKQLGVVLRWDAGTHVGVVTIEVSPNRRENQPLAQPADQTAMDTAALWVPLVTAQFLGATAIPAVANGVAATTLIIIPQTCFRRMRVRYAFTSGAGVLDAWLNGMS